MKNYEEIIEKLLARITELEALVAKQEWNILESIFAAFTYCLPVLGTE